MMNRKTLEATNKFNDIQKLQMKFQPTLEQADKATQLNSKETRILAFLNSWAKAGADDILPR